ncbi:MAG: DNA primase [Hyphomicrobiales bacterium]|nr:DNA primase [Hyphomicrobiales bacterium]MDE2114167.1 DNA primase [Hyphomicrobiales bacterium]
MKFSPAFLDEIRARVPVSEVVSLRVKLKKQGREWRGLSPFGAEKTPSFYVNDQKGFFHDFSSGKHGDGFGFLMETEGLSFPEAVEKLAGMAGLPMPVETEQSRAVEQARADLSDVLEWAAAYFEAQLQARDGAKARGYLADRGILADMQQHFRIGYAPNARFGLREALAMKGASVETMIEAGLLIHGEDIAVPYDRFRERVMFPICDRAGKVIAFGGRALDPQAQAKYLNSPETPLFHKGNVLFNHHNARKAAHDRGVVIAVEGYIDVVSMTSVGIPHVVAPLGTALGPEQCKLLWKMAEAPILCFDGDKAGRKAAYRAVETALPLLGPGRTFRFALLPEGQDPDDFARAGGAAAFTPLLEGALPLVELLWQREWEAHPLETPEQKAAFERRLKDSVKLITDDVLRAHYFDHLTEKLNRQFHRGAFSQNMAPHRNGQPAFNRAATPRGSLAGRAMMARKFASNLQQGDASLPPMIGNSLANSALFRPGPVAYSPRATMILLIIMHHPPLLAQHVEEIASLEFANKDQERMRQALVHLAAEYFADHSALEKSIDQLGLGEIRAKLESFAAISSLWSVSPQAAQSDADLGLHQALTLHRKTHALHQALRHAQGLLGNSDADAATSELSFARMRDIQEQLAALEGTEASMDGFGSHSGHASPDL